MATKPVSQSADGYRVRMYEPADLDQFRSLYEAVFDKQRSEQWVQWRYGGPYTDRVQMAVAERGGDLVGAEPFISLRVRADGRTVHALQPADAMVHEDHRGHGLLTRMTEVALDAYGDEEGFFFNFPNEAAKGTYLRLGWREVGETASAYRVHAPSKVADGLGLPAVADGVVADGYRRYDSLVRRVTGSLRRPDFDVTRYDDAPVGILESLYERAPPGEIHVPRTAEFYEWRLANPAWDVATYVASSGGDPVAALVVATQSTGGVAYTKVLDAVPVADPEPAALERLLAATVADHRSADAIVVAEDTIPRRVTARLGFLADDGVPLSALTEPSTVVARPFSLGGRTWSIGDRLLADRDDWELSLVGQDTSV